MLGDVRAFTDAAVYLASTNGEDFEGLTLDFDGGDFALLGHANDLGEGDIF